MHSRHNSSNLVISCSEKDVLFLWATSWLAGIRMIKSPVRHESFLVSLLLFLSRVNMFKK